MSLEIQKKPKLIIPNKPKTKTNIPLTKEEREEYYNILPNPVGYRMLIKPYIPEKPELCRYLWG